MDFVAFLSSHVWIVVMTTGVVLGTGLYYMLTKEQ
jgi:hypothetical protein